MKIITRRFDFGRQEQLLQTCIHRLCFSNVDISYNSTMYSRLKYLRCDMREQLKVEGFELKCRQVVSVGVQKIKVISKIDMGEKNMYYSYIIYQYYS